MKKLILPVFCVAVFFCAVNVYSQGLQTEIKIVRPDISGKWKLNLQRSRLPKGDVPNRLNEVSWIMIVEQKLPVISITVKVQRGVADDENFFGGRYTLYSDGRGDEYPADGSIRGASVTGWINNHLVTTIYSGPTKDPDQVSSVEEYELSADGNTLTQTERRTGSICGVSSGLKGGFDDTQARYVVFDRIK